MRFYNDRQHQQDSGGLFGKYDLTLDKTKPTVELLLMQIYNIQHQIERETKPSYTPRLS